MPDRMTMTRECETVGRALNFEVDLAVNIGGGELDVVWTKRASERSRDEVWLLDPPTER